MVNIFNSEYDVEISYINKLKEMGYEYISMSNYEDVCLNFRKQFCKFNEQQLIEAKGIAELSDSEFKNVKSRLSTCSIYESAKILREKWILDLDNKKKIYVDFFTSDVSKNIYQVSRQITMSPNDKKDVLSTNRYDVTIFINGLPLIQTELKKPGIELNEAINQINRYRRDSFRGLFQYIQLFIISNSTITKYCANINENDVSNNKQDIPKSLTFFWTNDQNQRISKLIEFTSIFLTKSNVTEILSKYFIIKETEPILIVMRPYQIYAVKYAYDRVIKENSNGYVFHTTGSGKTLTSYKLASLLRDNSTIEKVFFLVDRRDLDDQTIEEYNSFEKDCVDHTKNSFHLIQTMQNSSQKLIISTIQKLSKVLDFKKNLSIINHFKNKRCVFIIDECHRSQFGVMNAKIKKYFLNSNFIGFTGTPIFQENRGPQEKTTADIFSSKESEPCIHKYLIKDAISDGNVLRFSVEHMVTVDKKYILDSNTTINNVSDDESYYNLKNLNIDQFYHSEKRIAIISEHILDHLNQHIIIGNSKYTAIFAVDKIETLMKYYFYMKNHNPKRYRIAAIFHSKENTNKENYKKEQEYCIEDYNKLFQTDYTLEKFDTYRKDISRRMKQKETPQIDLLLVVNMFLTGFDSKPTNTLFLDKNLIWHSLVQAYSRTNRVEKPTKKYGQIITYRNIMSEQDNALRLFSGSGDPDEYLLKPYDYYLQKLFKEVNSLREIVQKPDDVKNLQSEEEIKSFIIIFRKLANYLSMLKTFSRFDWKDLNERINEEDYLDYKSWYLNYYEKQKKGEDISILNDIDFNIELIKTDLINVDYILNLLKNISQKKDYELEKYIDYILKEIEHSDNEKIRSKKEMIISFLKNKIQHINIQNKDILNEYYKYEKESLELDIQYFSKKYKLTKEFMYKITSQYFEDTRKITKEYLRENLLQEGIIGIIVITKLIDKILSFLRDTNT